MQHKAWIWGLGLAIGVSGCYAGANDGRSSGADDAADDAGVDSDADEDEDEPDGLDLECGTQLGQAPLRRLTRAQYDHTIRDLLKVPSDYASSFTADEKLGAFYNNAIAPVSDLVVEQYMAAAEQLSVTAVQDLDVLLPCLPAVSGEQECATDFIEEFGTRALRRPLTEVEKAEMLELFAHGQARSFKEGIRLVVQALIQSPQFLYHVEIGEEVPGTGLAALSDYEIASRLSYLLWDSMPDDELFDAAAAGTLTSAQGVRDQAMRMLADPRAKDAISTFHLQWMGVDDMSAVDKDPVLYPEFDFSLVQAMQDETANFADYVIRRGDGRLETLLTASFSIIDGPLFDLYGVERPSDHDPQQPVELDPTQRAGLITHASILAKNAHANQTSPIHRGVIVREHLLCYPLPLPPDDANDVAPDPSPDSTTRERFEEHTADPVCAACHSLIDPIGFGMENYDAAGAFRTMDGDFPVDSAGVLTGTDVDGPFDGAVELAHKLSQSNIVRACVTEQWFVFAFGRTPSLEDNCTTDLINEAFAASDYNVRELLVRLVTTDAFRYRSVGDGE
jgi:hypothetical protein